MNKLTKYTAPIASIDSMGFPLQTERTVYLASDIDPLLSPLGEWLTREQYPKAANPGLHYTKVLLAEWEALVAERDVQRLEIERLKGELESISELVKQETTEHNNFTRVAGQWKAEITTLKAELIEANTRWNYATTLDAGLDVVEDHRQLTQQVGMLKAEVEQLKEVNASLHNVTIRIRTEQRDKAIQQCRDYCDEINVMETRVKDLEQQHATLQAELEAMTRKRDLLKNAYDVLSTDSDELLSRNTRLEQQLAAREGQVKAVRQLEELCHDIK